MHVVLVEMQSDNHSLCRVAWENTGKRAGSTDIEYTVLKPYIQDSKFGEKIEKNLGL